MEPQKNFEELLKEVSGVLKRISYRLSRHACSFDEKDLFQEAAIRLWLDFRSQKLHDKTKSYIIQGSYFYLKNHIRKINPRNKCLSLQGLINDSDAAFTEPLCFQDEGSKYYLQGLNDKMLAQTILNNGLTGRERNILSLYAQGLTTRMIGARLGISHVRVVKLTAAIRKKCLKYRD
jgi:RNA polymerase sigma factor (sigma-70 family)